MELNLQRPLLFFDIESTGLNIPVDSIVELSFVKVFPGGEQRIKTWRIRPWAFACDQWGHPLPPEKGAQRPIAPSASAVNGIKDEDLRDCPRFFEVADEVVGWLKDADLAGFNSAKFDLPMLAEEIERARFFAGKDLDINLHDKKMVDVQNIYHVMEPRNLKAAHRFYCGGRDFDNAHTAEADTIATYEVLKGQLDMYSEPSEDHPQALKNDVDFLASFMVRPKPLDYAGRLIWNEQHEAVVNVGKHKGKTAREVWESEPSYFSWVERGDFTLDTKRQFSLLRKQFEKERREQKEIDRRTPPTEDSLRQLQDKFRFQ